MMLPDEYRTANVVLAEQPMNGWGLRAPLEALGHRVLAQAEEGEAALGLVERLNPDLVVMDVRLRGLDGLQAAARMQARRRRALVLVTPEWDAPALDAAVAAGALACLVRPVGVEQLGLTTQVVLARHAELAALEALRAELEGRMETGKLALRAKGVLMRRLGVGEGEAHLLLHHRARRTRRPLEDAIEEVLAADRFFVEMEQSLRQPPRVKAPAAPSRAPVPVPAAGPGGQRPAGA